MARHAIFQCWSLLHMTPLHCWVTYRPSWCTRTSFGQTTPSLPRYQCRCNQSRSPILNTPERVYFPLVYLSKCIFWNLKGPRSLAIADKPKLPHLVLKVASQSFGVINKRRIYSWDLISGHEPANPEQSPSVLKKYISSIFLRIASTGKFKFYLWNKSFRNWKDKIFP